MVVTLDGPAGAGKSSVAKALAQRLGFEFLDTGAMYRAVALAAFRKGIDWHDTERLVEIAASVRIELRPNQVLLNGEDVSQAIRSTTITGLIHHVADNPAIRSRLVELQRQAAHGRKMITEGRDQGTVAFPNSKCKIYLTATPEERARRRLAELAARGESVRYEDLLAQQNDRDRRDSTRPVGRLVKADDAIEIVTDDMTMTEVVDKLESLVRSRMEIP